MYEWEDVMKTYGLIEFKGYTETFYSLFRISKNIIPSEDINIEDQYKTNNEFHRIEEVLVAPPENYITLRKDKNLGFLFKWTDGVHAGAEFPFALFVDEKPEDYIFEFEDDDSALLWFKLNYEY